jgi:hypothetical protein
VFDVCCGGRRVLADRTHDAEVTDLFSTVR